MPRCGLERGPDAGNAGSGPVHVRVVLPPQPGRAVPMRPHAVVTAPRIRRGQLLHADPLDRITVLHEGSRADHRPGQHRSTVPNNHQQPVDPDTRVRVQPACCLDARQLGRGVHDHHQRVLLDAVRLLPGHHVFRAQHAVQHACGQL